MKMSEIMLPKHVCGNAGHMEILTDKCLGSLSRLTESEFLLVGS
jgi:hypothetical protein